MPRAPVRRGRDSAGSRANLVERWHDEYRTRGADAVLEEWRERDALAGRVVEVRGQGDPFRGVARGADRDGRLVVQAATGARYRVLTGEVAVVVG